MNPGPMESWRLETKYVYREPFLCELERILMLHPAMFREIYAGRLVNSIYLDTANLDFFHDSLDGVERRIKVRLRWYGVWTGTVRAPVVEIKKKLGKCVGKIRFPLPRLEASSCCRPETVRSLLLRADIPASWRELLVMLRPTLGVSYHRKYLLSDDGLYRITLDDRIETFPLSEGRRPRLSVSRSPDHVVELKYAVDTMTPFQLKRVPLVTTKNSKYVNGMLEFYA